MPGFFGKGGGVIRGRKEAIVVHRPVSGAVSNSLSGLSHWMTLPPPPRGSYDCDLYSTEEETAVQRSEVTCYTMREGIQI